MADEDKKQFSKDAREYRFTGRSHSGFDKKGDRKEFSKGELVMLEPEQFEAFKDQFADPKEDPKPVVKEEAPKTLTPGT